MDTNAYRPAGGNQPSGGDEKDTLCDSDSKYNTECPTVQEPSERHKEDPPAGGEECSEDPFSLDGSTLNKEGSSCPMTDSRIAMHRAPGVTEEEKRRRLNRAYRILVDAARKAHDRETADAGVAFQGDPAPAVQDKPTVLSTTQAILS